MKCNRNQYTVRGTGVALSLCLLKKNGLRFQEENTPGRYSWRV